MVSGPDTPIRTPEPRFFFFFFTPVQRKLQPTCYGRLLLGGRGQPTLLRGGGNSLGTVLPAVPDVPRARPPEAGAGPPARASAAPGARGVTTRCGGRGRASRAACSPRGTDIGVTQRVSFPNRLSGVGAGW